MMAPQLACPRCGADVAPAGMRDADVTCDRGHVIACVAGILDCRGEVPGFDVEADRLLAHDLAAMGGATFEELLRRYWTAQPVVDEERVERFVQGDLIGSERAVEVVSQIEDEVPGLALGDVTALEVGSGTAALGAALAVRAGYVVATDVSLAWLVLAKARVEGLGLTNVTLVAATADTIPFASETFDLVVAADVIEHVPDPAAMARSCYLALRGGGTFWLSTPNRLSLTPEPHVRLWGVGLLPRPLAVRFVRRFRGIDYGDIRTLSLLRLHRLLRSTGGVVCVQAPPIAQAVRATYGRTARRLIDAYHLLRRLPATRHGLLIVTPLFHATVRKGDRAS